MELRRLWPAPALACVLFASAAYGKGGTGPAASEASAAQLAPNRAADYAVRGCGSPSLSQCESFDFRFTRCGAIEARRAGGRVQFGDCFEQCGQQSPTLAQCQDEAWMNSICGVLERERMDLDPLPSGLHPSACVELIKAEGTDAFMGAPVETVLVPPELDCDGCATPNSAPLSLTTAYTIEDDRSDYDIEPSTSNYYGNIAEDFTHLSKPPNSDLHQGRFLESRAVWAASGQSVSSCREYVYEKYYNFNAYLDRAAGVAPNHRAMYDIAYETNGPVQPQPWAVGERGRLKLPVQHFQTVIAAEPQVTVGDGPEGRNVFFQPLYMSSAEREAAKAYFASGGYTTPRPVGTGIFLFDDDLHARMALGALPRNRAVKDFDYHRTMGEALTPDLIEPQFRLYEGARGRFAALLWRYNQAYVAWTEFLTQIVQDAAEPIPELVIPNLPGSGLILPPSIDATPVAKTLQAGRELKAARRAQHGLRTQISARPDLPLQRLGTGAPSVRFSAIFPGAAEGGVRGGPAPSLDVFGTAGDLDALEFDAIAEALPPLVSPQDCNTKQCFLDNFAFLEGLIEAELLAARELGCLDTEAPPHPCDWSPRMFVEALGDPYEAVREVEYRGCVEDTPNDPSFDRLRSADFSYGASAQVTVWDGEPCTAGDYTNSIARVDRFFECRVEWVKNVLEDLQMELDEPSLFDQGPPKQLFIGKEDSDHARVGNDMFGAQFDYDIGWSVPGSSIPEPGEGSFCTLEPSARGSVSARGRALFLEKHLVDASAEVSLKQGEPSSAFLEVAGQEIFQPDPVQLSANAFNPVLEAQEDLDETIVKASATITIVFIPVKIAGGISGRLTAGAALAGGAQKGSSCQNGDLGIIAEFTPAMALDAFASVSIDALIIEAGVQITLTIIEVGLPFSNELRFDGLADGSDTRLSAGASLDLYMELLSGRVSAFVEVCYLIDCERAEATLFSWDGPTLTENIFDTAFEVRLEPLAIAQSQLGSLDGN